MKYSIIIVNYNSGDLLARAVRSIRDLDMPREKYEVMIVDNGSKDESLTKVEWGDVDRKIIMNQENKGFAAANNQALSLCRGEYVVLLNPDTEILNDIFEILGNFAGLDDRIGICGPRVYYPDGGVQLSCHSFPSIWRKVAEISGLTDLLMKSLSVIKFIAKAERYLPAPFKVFLRNFSDTDQPSEVPWISGVCMFIRRPLIDDIGLFDEDFFLYSEDEDLCLRGRKAGYRIYYVPEAKIEHQKGLDEDFKRAGEVQDAYFGSLEKFYKKHYRGIKRNILLFLNGLDRRAVRFARKKGIE